MGVAVQVSGAAKVDTLKNGRIAAWVGMPDNAFVMSFDAGGALETARRLIGAVTPGPQPDFVGELAKIEIFPPVGPAPGRLVFSGSGTVITLTMGWNDLTKLAAVAQLALDATIPDGCG